MTRSRPSLKAILEQKGASRLQKTMKRLEVLRQYAADLRMMAETFDIPQIKEDLLMLAESSDRLAVVIEREIWKRRAQPISGKPHSS